ncbi:hypothetical protein ACEPAF_91 [Sanghuangporus sanghuang]
MPLLFPSEKKRERLMNDYMNLLKVREEKIGYVVEDPTTNRNAVESLTDMHNLQYRLQALERSTIGKKGFRKRLSGIFGRNEDEVVRELLRDIHQAKQEYEKRTMSRSLYGILAPLSFCSKGNLSKVMGDKCSGDVLLMTWTPHFQQLSVEEIDVGLLDVAGITEESLEQWWYEDNSGHSGQESNIWDDIKSLSLRLVCVFDETFKGRYCPRFPTKLKPLRARFKRLGIWLARLVYIRLESVDVIRPLFDLLVPVTFWFSILVCTDRWIDSQDAAIKFLESYLSVMESLFNNILAQLNAEDEMEEYVERDEKSWDKSNSSINKEADPLDVSLCVRDSLTSKLNAMGIPEISFDPSQVGERLGNGSFADVRKMFAQDGSVFAVKFFKKKASTERTKDRILREADRWRGLSHANVNPLVGFCAHPQRNFPGLVSNVLRSDLKAYLDDNDVKELDRLAFLAEIAEALRYLHEEKGLAHGDVRPANVLLDSDLTAKISDFGVSYYEDSNEKTTTNQHTHKYYLAPELNVSKNKGGLRQVSQKGDIYAFGCCFLEVYCDIEMQEDTITRFKKAASSPEKRPVILEEKIDIQLEHWQFLERVWDKRPEKRPSAKEVLECMRRFMA